MKQIDLIQCSSGTYSEFYWYQYALMYFDCPVLSSQINYCLNDSEEYEEVNKILDKVNNVENKQLCYDKLSKEDIEKIFSDAEQVFYDTSINLDNNGEILSRFVCGNIAAIYKDRIFVVNCTNVICYYVSKNIIDNVEHQLHEIFKQLPFVREDEYRTVKLVIRTNSGYSTVTSEVNEVNIIVEENYNDDFIPAYKDLKRFLASRESGLALLHGMKGTGKTNVIRFLINTCDNDFVIVPNNLVCQLGDPQFTSFMLNNKNSVFILEDCEQILKDRSENIFDSAISNILNMSDGLLSDIFNIKFICTFNADIGQIDSALTRKGRCFVNYEFGPLKANKVRILNDKYNLGIPDKEITDMTLADIYNYHDTDCDEKPKARKIGF